MAHGTTCTAIRRAPESRHHPALPLYPPALLVLCEGLQKPRGGDFKVQMGCWGAASVSKVLAGKHETLRSIPRTPLKLLGMGSCTYSLSDGEVERGGSWGSLAI